MKKQLLRNWSLFLGNGYLSAYNADGKLLVGIGSADGGTGGAMEILNADVKTLVCI